MDEQDNRIILVLSAYKYPLVNTSYLNLVVFLDTIWIDDLPKISYDPSSLGKTWCCAVALSKE